MHVSKFSRQFMVKYPWLKKIIYFFNRFKLKFKKRLKPGIARIWRGRFLKIDIGI